MKPDDELDAEQLRRLFALHTEADTRRRRFETRATWVGIVVGGGLFALIMARVWGWL